LTLKIVAIDTSGNEGTPVTYSFVPATNAGTPAISNLTPAPGELANRNTAIEFDVTDASPGLRLVMVTIKYANRSSTFVVHDGNGFMSPFDDGFSLRTAITNGYHYKLLPGSGWLDEIETLAVYVVDQAGNAEGSLP
jgi:hypothetical protein